MLLLPRFLSFFIFLLTASSIVTAEENCTNNYWSSELTKINAIIDDVTSPCEDFHQYACGLWRVPYKLRYLHARDTLTTLRASNEQLLIDYLEQQWIAENHTQDSRLNHDGVAGDDGNAARGVAGVIQFFESCMNNKIETETRGRDNLQIYRNLLLGISDWPVLNPDYPTHNQINASFNWPFVSARLRRYGVNSFWSLLVQQNWQAAEQTVIYLAPLRFELLGGESTNFDEEKLVLYKHYIKQLMLALNVRVRAANRIADEVIEFEQELRSLSTSELDSVLHEPQTLHSLDQESPTFNLKHYFDNLFDDEQTQSSSDYAHRLLIVTDKNHLRRLVALLSRTNTETIGKYLLVKFLIHFGVHLQHEQQDYNEQKHDCLQQMHNLLPRQLTHLYMRLLHKTNGTEDYGRDFLQRTQIELTSMFEQLKQQFEKMLNATNIFDRDAVSRALGLEKLRSMRLLLPSIEQPTNAINPRIENELTSNYHQNLLVLHKFQTIHELEPIVQLISQVHAGGDFQPSMRMGQATQYSPLNVNAYYKLKNIIELPIGLLRSPIYDRCMAPGKIYGGLLYIIAHELMHGFDYDGMNFDKSGNVANAWSPKTIIRYGVGASCFMTSRYPNAPLNINENIADNEGLRLALESFLQSNDFHAASQRVEQLKLFFISFAQVWCGREATEGNSGGTAAITGLHASHKDRVNNAVRNFEEFVEAFKCRKGQEMYAEEKCRIW